jgi:hypothetical protein
MNAPLNTLKNVREISADDLIKMLRAGKSVSNKEAFLRAARGTMTEKEATEMLRIIDDACERIDE